jgi:hypothetical protein
MISLLTLAIYMAVEPNNIIIDKSSAFPLKKIENISTPPPNSLHFSCFYLNKENILKLVSVNKYLIDGVSRDMVSYAEDQLKHFKLNNKISCNLSQAAIRNWGLNYFAGSECNFRYILQLTENKYIFLTNFRGPSKRSDWGEGAKTCEESERLFRKSKSNIGSAR